MKCKTLLAGTLLLALCSCSQMNYTGLLAGATQALQGLSVSDGEVQSYVHQYVAQMDAKSQIAPDGSKYSRRLAKLTQGLNSVDGVPLNFKVYMTPDINAFACADGSVRVYSGLMDRMSDDEVLGVIGHEIGHVAHKDTKNAFKSALLTSALRSSVSSFGGTVGALTDSQLGDITESLVNSRYSQKQEQNADDYGYDFLKSHGKNPWAMAMAFEKLQELEQAAGAQSNAVNQLFSSHPDIGSRVNRMKQKAIKDGYTRPKQ